MRRSTAGRTRSISSYWCGVTGDDDAGRSALPSAYRDRARSAGEAHNRAGIGRGGNCPARAIRGTPARLFVLGAGAGSSRGRRGRCGILRRGIGRPSARAAGLDQGPVRRRRISLLRRIEPAPARRSMGAGRAAGRDAAPSARGHHGQDPYGRVRIWRHRPEQPPWGAVQPVGCGGASLGRRFVERRRG